MDVTKLKIGYARVSTGLQNLDLQIDSLEKDGCEKIFQIISVAQKVNALDWTLRLIFVVLEIRLWFGV